MSSSYDRFGGWLRFLWVLTLVSGAIHLLLVGLVLSRPSMLVDDALRSSITSSSVLVHAVVNGFLSWYCFYMVWLIPKREPDVPASIGAFVIISAGLRGILVLGDYMWGSSSVANAIGGDRFHLSELARTVIGAAIWYQYVKVSERVRAYYGANAFTGDPMRPHRAEYTPSSDSHTTVG